MERSADPPRSKFLVSQRMAPVFVSDRSAGRSQRFPQASSNTGEFVDNSPLLKLGFVLVIFDLFFTYSRFPELVTIWFGTNLAMARIARMGGFGISVMNGGLFRSFSSPIGVALAMFSVWLLICLPFSAWKGGSVAMLRENWIPVMLAFIAVNGIIVNIKHVYRCIYVIAASSFVIVAMSGTFGAVAQNRMAFELGTLSNANDLATLVLLGSPPMILFFQLNPGRRRLLLKLAILATVPYMLMIVLQTASRGALLNLVLMCAIAFLVSPLAGKVKILLASFALGIIVISFAPRESLARYATLLPFLDDSASDAARITNSAAASSAAREHMLRESIELTLKNPIFGVGPGVFIAAQAHQAESEGERPIWLASHNGYTQISSETGIPGFLLYMVAFATCFKYILSIRKRVKGIPQLQHIQHISLCLLLAMSCMALNYCLGSIAYLPMFPILAAITDGFYRTAIAEITKWQHAASGAAAKPHSLRMQMPIPRGF